MNYFEKKKHLKKINDIKSVQIIGAEGQLALEHIYDIKIYRYKGELRAVITHGIDNLKRVSDVAFDKCIFKYHID